MWKIATSEPVALPRNDTPLLAASALKPHRNNLPYPRYFAIFPISEQNSLYFLIFSCYGKIRMVKHHFRAMPGAVRGSNSGDTNKMVSLFDTVFLYLKFPTLTGELIANVQACFSG